jgi:hypothetical protein
MINDLPDAVGDKNNLLDSGAMGLIVEDGTLVTDEIVVG